MEEGFEFAVSSVDCVSSEHSPHMLMKSYFNNQPKHTIGMMQTAKLQVTDVCMAKLGKGAGEVAKVRRRRMQRLKARMQGAVASLVSKHLDLMHVATAMQSACIGDNSKNK